MRHGRADWDERIQDAAGLIPADEPVFLIRGQDAAAVAAIKDYARQAGYVGASAAFCDRIERYADEVDQWQSANRTKIPDAPETELAICGWFVPKMGRCTLPPHDRDTAHRCTTNGIDLR